MRKHMKWLVWASLSFMPSIAWAAPDYGAAGPLATTTTNLGSTEGGSIGGYLVVPSGAGPFPLVIASHGWSAAADQQLGWAKQFASWGFVVVAPSFPNSLSPNDMTDATVIGTLAKSYADPSYASPAQGKVAPHLLGLEGHSAGGLATTIAAAAIEPQAVVLFDPVDSNSDGQHALPSICGPLLGEFADPSSCNNQEAWWPYANTAAGAEVLFHVVGSTHCDGENPPRSLCGGVCGGAADATREATYARYATAFFLAHLAGDATAAATLDIGPLSGDTTITSVIVKPAGTCGGSPSVDAGPASDAGAPPSLDAGRPVGDAASTSGMDAEAPPAHDGGGGGGGSATEGGAASSERPVSSSSGGCGCSASSSKTSLLGPVGVLAFGLVAVRRRRRRSRSRTALQTCSR